MDPQNQELIKRVVEELGDRDLIVMLGAADEDAVEVAVETVREGDPAYVGPLAGVQLGLTVMHVFEDQVRDQVDPAVYEEHVGFYALSFDVEAIVRAMKRARGEI